MIKNIALNEVMLLNLTRIFAINLSILQTNVCCTNILYIKMFNAELKSYWFWNFLWSYSFLISTLSLCVKQQFHWCLNDSQYTKLIYCVCSNLTDYICKIVVDWTLIFKLPSYLEALGSELRSWNTEIIKHFWVVGIQINIYLKILKTQRRKL